MSNLRFMRTFVAVARTGSFSAAAEKMALTQAGISTQMRALEEEFRHELFDRSGRTAVLNDYGKAILPQVEQMLAIYGDIRAAAGEDGQVAGMVSIGAVVSAMGALAKTVTRLKRTNTGLDVRLLTGKSVELVGRVEAGEIDAAVTVEPPSRLPSTFDWWMLYTEPLVVVAPRHVTLRDPVQLIEASPFLRFDRTQHTGALIDRALKKLRVHVDDFLELNSLETIVELVRQDVGVTLVPQLRSAGWEQDPKLRLIPLYGKPSLRTIGMIERKGQHRTTITQLLRKDILLW